MQYLYVVLPLIVMVAIILITKKVTFKQVINAIFFGLLSSILVLVVGSVFHLDNLSAGMLEVSFAVTLLQAAIPEELAKFICIKSANSKTKTTIFINSILVAISFAVLENVFYMWAKGYTLGLSRTLAPGHFIFELAMAIFLILALNSKGIKKITFTLLALVVPILLHASFNAFNIDSNIMMIVGGISYLFAIIYIITLPKENAPVKKYPLKVVGCIAVVLLTIILLVTSPSVYNMNKDVFIKENNITMNVMSIETIEEESNAVSLYKYKYKIKMKIENNDKIKDYEIGYINFRLVNEKDDKKRLIYINDENDNELDEAIIKAGETKNVYLYFGVNELNYSYLKYNTSLVDSSTYTFILK